MTPQDINEKHQHLRAETEGIQTYVELARHCLDSIECFPPASEKDVSGAEAALSIVFPEELKKLWKETDGLYWHGYPLVMQVPELQTQNRAFRDGDICDFYMPFDSLLVFGETATGDYFFYPIQRDGKTREDIFLLDHEIDSRQYFCHNLRELIISLSVGKY